ncbi:MAG TPA: ABC transporter permease [Bryobacteraceae bacterium]|nr:ABC transporter permease [Bryobacteraceae bacterium]
MDAFLNELKHSLRTFRRNPGFTLTALAALTLGIGTNTAIFSVVNRVLLKPVAAPYPDKIIVLGSTRPNGPPIGGSPTRFNLWREQTALFQDISAYRYGSMNLTGVDAPEQIEMAQVSADYFRLFGFPIAQGRSFSTDEDRPHAGNFAVLSDGFWRRGFSAAPMLGKTVSLNGAPYVVVGITGPNVETESPRPIDVWVPFQIDPATTDQSHYFSVAARIRSGVTPGAIKAQLQLATDEFRRRWPGVSTTLPGVVFVAEPMKDVLDRNIRSSLLILAVAVSFVLMIACANVANLLLVRAAGRKREIAIRVAIGATRARLVRQLLSESIVLSLAGGVLGLILGIAGIRALLALNPGDIPRIGQSGIAADWRVVCFTMLLSLATGILFGLIPALQASRIDMSSVPRKATARAFLVVSEVSLALVLLIGSGLLIRSFVSMRSIEPGFETHNVLTLQMSLTGAQYQKTAGLSRLVDQSVERIRALPGIEIAASGCCLPIGGAPNAPFVIAGRPLNGTFHDRANMPIISPDYFDVFKIPILRGRKFTDRDVAGAPGVVIIDQYMAKRFWPNDDAIGARISLGSKTATESSATEPKTLEIVGVAGNVRGRTDRSTDPQGNTIFIPVAQNSDGFTAYIVRNPTIWMVRTRVEPHSLASAIKNELVQASGGLAVVNIRSMDEVESASTAGQDFNMVLMLIFGGSALLLAAIGIYGLMAFSVEQRTREIGIRIALGAGNVQTMVIRQGMQLVLLGTVIGVAAALGLTRFLTSFLYGVATLDPAVFIAVPILLAAVALAAIWIPARRASRVDPIQALRCE